MKLSTFRSVLGDTFSQETVVYNSADTEKKQLGSIVRDELSRISQQEEKFEEIERGRDNTPLTDKVRTLIIEEKARVEREHPEIQPENIIRPDNEE
jgi:hypothetical protein|nr:MAG TPA: hypothetical protein [Caudoviricetes sp.]